MDAAADSTAAGDTAACSLAGDDVAVDTPVGGDWNPAGATRVGGDPHRDGCLLRVDVIRVGDFRHLDAFPGDAVNPAVQPEACSLRHRHQD